MAGLERDLGSRMDKAWLLDTRSRVGRGSSDDVLGSDQLSKSGNKEGVVSFRVKREEFTPGWCGKKKESFAMGILYRIPLPIYV